ncbi:hypothetical protein [Stutzerimonas zhaodongensis]|uniref:hypothetical protein n=1 Tax=Stutzerimonas TaxID=2901164 RepID=UPI00388E5F7D
MTAVAEIEEQVGRLLLTGLSERKIAEQAGITRRQVRNIKERIGDAEGDDNPFAFDVGPTISRSQAVSELVNLSVRPEGVRKSEMWPVLRALFGLRLDDESGRFELNMTDNQLRYLKDKTKEAAQSRGKDALFLPEWLPRRAPCAAVDMLTNAAHSLVERAHEYTADFLAAFPEVSPSAVFHELISLSFRQACPEPVITRCERNKETADRLQLRLDALMMTAAANDSSAAPPVMFDPELDRICL